jgi:serine protease Do
MGIGFAIPVNIAKRVMDDIIKYGKVSRGYLGVLIQDITPDFAKAMDLKEAKGAVITKVEKGSPADKAGLKEDDIVIRFNDKDIENSSELRNYVGLSRPGTKVTLTIIRNGKERRIKVKIGEFPEGKTFAAAESGSEVVKKLGLTVRELDRALKDKYDIPENVDKGVVVVKVDPGSLAQRVGMQEGDVIAKVNRTRIHDLDDYKNVLKKLKPGDSVAFYIIRKEARFYASFRIPKDKE